MTQQLDEDTAAKVFAAARAAHFINTNLGQTASVWVDGYDYRVIVTPTHRAHTDCREGYGGTEFTFANATPEQDRALRAALKPQAAPSAPPTRTTGRNRTR